MTTTSCESLWLEVKQCAEGRSDSNLSTLWRRANPNLSECDFCTELGGVLIKCNHDRCKREYHPDCAFHATTENKGSLSLNNEGILSYTCSHHFKPVLFCICHQKYDETRVMICCDECVEWYHCSCVGLNDEDANTIDKYICQSCSIYLKDGKPIPAGLKDKNLQKELISSWNQTGVKAVGSLVEIAQIVCPVIDSMTENNRINYSIDKVIESMELISTIYPSKDDENSEMDKEDDETEHFNTENLVIAWKHMLVDYHDKYKSWFQRLNALVMNCETKLMPVAIKTSDKSTVSSLADDTKALESEIQSFCIVDVEIFTAFMESIMWVHDLYLVRYSNSLGHTRTFTTLFHMTTSWLILLQLFMVTCLVMYQIISSTYEESEDTMSICNELTNKLNIHLRTANPRVRKLMSFQSKDSLFTLWLPIFQDFVRVTHELSVSLADWSKKTSNIMSGKFACSLNDIKALIDIAKGADSLCYNLITS